jgi:hypothetical protein
MRSTVIVLAVSSLFAPSALAADAPVPEHKITQSESYMMLEPMYATVIDGDRPNGTLMVAIGLDIPDPVLRANAEHAMPILRDAYVRNLMAFAWSHVRPWVQPDVAEIADRLQHVTDHTLKKTGARVLLAEVVVRVTR